MTFGFHCSHEQHSPAALLRYARLADAAGFRALMCSDHFHPWSGRQGHSGHAWSWLGAALQVTSASIGTVCAPGQRYHPAIVAQAAATLAEMFPSRFWLAVGSGEALNESITGEAWPPKEERRARLEEAVSVMRELWAGDTVTVADLVQVREARLYSVPAQPPLLVAAALSPETARWAGEWADALITVNAARGTMHSVVDAFRDTAGADKPIFLQVALSFAPSEEAARTAAHEQWRHATLPPEQLADLRTPAEFDAATARATVDEVARAVRVSADIQRHAAWLREDAGLGFERIYLHNVAREHQELFIEACAKHLL